VAETDRKYKSEESLIAKAKAEYLKKTMPTDKLTSSGNGACMSYGRHAKRASGHERPGSIEKLELMSVLLQSSRIPTTPNSISRHT